MAQTAATPDCLFHGYIPPAECAEWGCDGNGRQVQGWTDKNGYPEDQYGECSRPCGRPIPPAEEAPHE